MAIKKPKSPLYRAAIAFVFLFLPVLQFYSLLVALPLMLIPVLNSASKYMEYTFLYFYPKHPLSIGGFAIYYLCIFYALDFFRKKLESWKK